MTTSQITPGLQFFGNLVSLDCHMQDLKLLLRKMEEIEFPVHVDALEGDSLTPDIFPDITRKGFIVTLLIELENQFKVFCEILRDATAQSLKWTDLKGTSLERFITYSEKVAGIEPICETSNKQMIIGLIEVRNCIVHNNSSLEGFSKRKAIENFMKKLPGMNIENHSLAPQFDACNVCADLVLQFMEYAYDSALRTFPK